MNVIDLERANALGEAARNQREARSLALAARVVDSPRMRRNFLRQAKVWGRWCETNLWFVEYMDGGLL